MTQEEYKEKVKSKLIIPVDPNDDFCVIGSFVRKKGEDYGFGEIEKHLIKDKKLLYLIEGEKYKASEIEYV